MKRLTLLLFATALPLLASCGQSPDTSQPQGASSQPQAQTTPPDTVIGRNLQKAMDKAHAKLATENISLTDLKISGGHGGFSITSTDDEKGNALPKAEITPQGELLIEGKKVATDAAQQALLIEYRKQVEGVAGAGMDLGIQGAELGIKAATEAMKGLFTGNADDVEQRVNVEAEQIKAAAMRLCDQLPPMLETQGKLASSLAAFKPYATMTQADIDDCRKQDTDTGNVQQHVQHKIRDEIRQGIRASVQSAAQDSGLASSSQYTNTAAQAEAAANDATTH